MTTVAKLGELVEDLQSGFACGESVDDGIVQLRMNNVDTEGNIDLSVTRRVPRDAIREMERFLVVDGDVMFNNTNSPELVGKSAVFRGFSEPLVFSNHFTRIRVRRDRLEPRYLSRWLASEWKRGRFERMCNQWVNQASVRKDALLGMDVPVRPIAEQRRIADILDKADAIRRKRKEAISLTDELLRSTFLDMFGDIPARRSRWPFVPLRPYLSASSGKSSKSVLSANETTIPVYGGNGVNGWATQALYDEPVVVVGRVGQQCGITKMTEGPSWVTDNAIVVSTTCPDVLNAVYLMTALQHSPLRASVMRLDLPFINQSTILDYPLPLPPLAMQDQFADFRSHVLSSQGRLRAAHEESEDLFGSLMQRGFRGELARA